MRFPIVSGLSREITSELQSRLRWASLVTLTSDGDIPTREGVISTSYMMKAVQDLLKEKVDEGYEQAQEYLTAFNKTQNLLETMAKNWEVK